MRWSVRRSIVGTVVLLAGIVGLEVTMTDAADAVPDAEFKALVEQDAKNIVSWAETGDDAAKKKLKGKMSSAQRAVKSNAIMIAAVAQSRITGKDPAKDGQMIALRDAALSVAKSAGEKKFAAALADGKTLSPNIPAGKGGKAAMTIADLVAAAALDQEELMHQFKKEVSGGLGIEEKIKANGKKLAMNTADIAPLVQRVLVVSDYCNEIAPQGGFSTTAPKKTWDMDNKKMKEAALELLAGAKANDKKAMQSAFTKLDGACVSCHNTFKK